MKPEIVIFWENEVLRSKRVEKVFMFRHNLFRISLSALYQGLPVVTYNSWSELKNIEVSKIVLRFD